MSFAFSHHSQVSTDITTHQLTTVRNSKLTQLLCDALSGSSKVLVVCQLSPDASEASESLSSLGFASRAAQVELGAARRGGNAGNSGGSDASAPSSPGRRGGGDACANPSPGNSPGRRSTSASGAATAGMGTATGAQPLAPGARPASRLSERISPPPMLARNAATALDVVSGPRASNGAAKPARH